eukprot:COSAG02_NODE_3428_length_6761_cov_2.354398_5_plen_150_part_00
MISFLCFAVMGCVMFGFKMTEFKTVTDAFHALFNMSIGDTGLWEEMRRIHPLAGTVYQYVFFLFMGFTMINIFLAIIMDSYAEVVGEARSRGAHTILHDLNKAQVRVKIALLPQYARLKQNDTLPWIRLSLQLQRRIPSLPTRWQRVRE